MLSTGYIWTLITFFNGRNDTVFYGEMIVKPLKNERFPVRWLYFVFLFPMNLASIFTSTPLCWHEPIHTFT